MSQTFNQFVTWRTPVWPLTLAAVIVALTCVSVSGDTVDAQWVFSQAGNTLGWTSVGCSSSGVAPGYWWGETSTTAPALVSQYGLNIAPAGDPGTTSDDYQSYVSIRMRVRSSAGPNSFSGPTLASIQFLTDWTGSNTWQWAENNRESFRVWGTGEWKVYNIWMGQRWSWVNRVMQMKIELGNAPGSHVEVAWVRVMRDTTPPTASAETAWSYRDNSSTPDTTPTLEIRDYYDDVSSIEKVAFYRRPGASTSEAAWVLSGTLADGTSGYSYTFPTFAPGTYDLGVRVYDRAGNAASWLTTPKLLVDNLTVDTATVPRITVDAATSLGATPRGLFGSNLVWDELAPVYDPVSKRLPDNVETMVRELGPTVMRYPGGCAADTFYWKQTIGSPDQRVDQNVVNCTTGLLITAPPVFGLDDFLQFCEGRGIAPMLTCRFRWPAANVLNPYLSWPASQPYERDGADPYQQALQDAADLVEYCNAEPGTNPGGGIAWAAVRDSRGHRYPYYVKLFEVGNEPDGPDCYGSPSRVIADAQTARTAYALTYRRYRDAMRAIDPSIVVTAESRFDVNSKIDQSTGNYIFDLTHQVGPIADSISVHPYYPWERTQTNLDELYKETMAASRVLDENLGTFRSIAHFAAPDRQDSLKLSLSEWELSYHYLETNPLSPMHARTLKSAIGAADMLRVMIENRDVVREACWWHLAGNTPYSSFSTVPNPIYHTLRVFASHFGDDLVPSSVTGSPTFDYIDPPDATYENLMRTEMGTPYLSAVASRSADSSSLYLIVINKHRSSALPANVDLSSFLPGSPANLRAELWEVNGQDLELNAPSSNDPSLFDPANVTTKVSSGTFNRAFTYAFPAHSITSFRFCSSTPTAVPVGQVGKNSPLFVQLNGKVVTARIGPDTLYVEEPDRSSGIKVISSNINFSEGDRVDVVGLVVCPVLGERYIAADSVTLVSHGAPLRPLMSTRETWSKSNITTTGLLVQTWGVIASKCTDSFIIGGTQGYPCEANIFGLKIYCQTPPEIGEFVQITGILSMEKPGVGRLGAPVVLTRSGADINRLDVPDIFVQSAAVGKDLQQSSLITLERVPAQPATVTVTVGDESVATISKDPNTVGTGTLVFTGVTTTNVSTIYVQGRRVADTTITATAMGYNNAKAFAWVHPSAFLILEPASVDTTPTSASTPMKVVSSRLDPATLARSCEQPLRGGFSVSVPVVSSNTSVGQIIVSPLSFNTGQTLQTTGFTPVGTGTASLAVQQPPGFTTPSAMGEITAAVKTGIMGPTQTVGKDLQAPAVITLQNAPAQAVTVTVTSASPAIATLSRDPLAAGTSTVTFTNVTGTTVGTVYVQGRDVGDTALVASAPGYQNSAGHVWVMQSGFTVLDPVSITTTSGAANTTIQVASSRLNADLSRANDQPIRGGLTVSVPVVCSNISVGTLTTSPITFGPNESLKTTEFDPAGFGTATITVQAPPGFSTPSSRGQIPVTIKPLITGPLQTVGKDLQAVAPITLQSAPSQPITVTVTSAHPEIATLSRDPLAEGSATVTFTNVTTTAVGTVYVQGRAVGATPLVASAPGYQDSAGYAWVEPSGFVILDPAEINTTAVSPGTPIKVVSSRLNSGTLTRSCDQPIRGGLTVSVNVTSSAPGVGVTAPGTLSFGPNESSKSTVFAPLGYGATTITAEAPPGFSRPSAMGQIPANVLPRVLGPTATVGKDLQVGSPITLEKAPSQPITVTVTSGNPSLVTLSRDPLVAGSGSLTFTNVTTTTVGTVYVQGRALGTTLLTASAPGYANNLGDGTVTPSGFIINDPPDFNISRAGANRSIEIQARRLASNGTVSSPQAIRGGLTVAVSMSNSNPTAGSIVINPVSFSPGDTARTTAFHPLAVGVTNLAVVQPAGFSTPTIATRITATVTP